MPDPDAFVLHRPELADGLRRGDEKIARLMAGDARTLARGATIIRQGADHDLVHRVRTGWAGRVRVLPDGRSQFILVFLPGELFAVKSMFLTRHGDAVEALSDVTLEQVGQRDLKAAYDRDADIATRCMFQVVEEERRLHSWVVGLGQANAEERMAHMLLDFRDRLVRAGVLGQGGTEFRLPMTQEQMAGFLGITAVHVGRVLKRLKDAVAIQGGKARLLDAAALERIAAAVQDDFERGTRGQGGNGGGAVPR